MGFWDLKDACIVHYNDDTLMIIGGKSCDGCPGKPMEKSTRFFDMKKNTVTEGPELINGRYKHACQVVTIGQHEYIVVTGGIDTMYSTEMLRKLPNYEDHNKHGQLWQAGDNVTFCFLMAFVILYGFLLLI